MKIALVLFLGLLTHPAFAIHKMPGEAEDPGDPFCPDYYDAIKFGPRNDDITLSFIQGWKPEKPPVTYDPQLNLVTVADPLTGREITYARTGRGLNSSTLHPNYVQGLRDLGKKVFDAGTGEGKMVEDLRSIGVEAYGMDIHLAPEQFQKYFLKGNIASTGLAPNQFDVVLSSNSLFFYERKKLEKISPALKELARITKPGGEIRLLPCDLDTIKKAMKGNELEITHQEKLLEYGDQNVHLVILRKKPSAPGSEPPQQ